MPFLILFVFLPILELFVFIDVIDEIGFFSALGLLILAGMGGMFLIRHQGFFTLLAMREAAQRGQIPLSAVFDSFCLTIAGLLLIFPGFVTDFVALVLLIPSARILLRNVLRKRYPGAVDNGDPSFYGRPPPADVIEGEYERLDE